MRSAVHHDLRRQAAARSRWQASDGRLTEVADSEHFKRRLSPDALHQQAGTLFLPPQQRSQGARLFGSLPEMRLWQGHQFFHDFVGAGDYAGALAVVQVLRDPVDRCVSAFYWNRDRVFNGGRLSPEASEALRDINAWAASPYFSGPPRGIMETPVDVDVRNLPPERDGERQRMLHVWSECNNYQTRWLCGMDDICNAPHSKAALDRALANLREKHAA